MSAIFKLKKFLRYINDEILIRFFASQNIEIELTEKDDKEKREDYLERIINDLDLREAFPLSWGPRGLRPLVWELGPEGPQNSIHTPSPLGRVGVGI